MVSKPMYSFTQMVNYFKKKGIKLNKPDADIINALETRNYFYKLISFRKNFPKDTNDKYINLSFDMLSDISTLDMHLRYLLLKMCLDLEHKLKTLLLAEITNDPSQNGHSLVDHFIVASNDPTKLKKNMLGSAAARKSYNKPLYDKYKDHPPIWVVFETMSFGTLVEFVDFYIKLNPSTKYKFLENKLVYVKNIRNTAAHSSSLLNDIVSTDQIEKPTPFVTSYVYKKMTNKAGKKKLGNMRIHDLTMLYLIYNQLIPRGGMKTARRKELHEFYRRAVQNKDFYTKHNQITSVFNYFIKLTVVQNKK